MAEEMSKRIDSAKDDLASCEMRSAERWRLHIEDHRIDDTKRMTNKHFIIGVVFLSVFQTGVAVTLHFIG